MSNVLTLGGGGGAGPTVEMMPDDADNDDVNMAGASVTVGEDGVITIDPGKPERPRRATQFDDNLAEDIDSGVLAALAENLMESIEADKKARAEWEDTANRAPKYLGVKLEEPATAGDDGTVSKQVSTALLESVVKIWSTGRAELLPIGGPVKVKRDDMPGVAAPDAVSMGHNGGPPLDEEAPATGVAAAEPGGVAAAQPPAPTADRDELANALESDLNWYLTKGDPEYYPDFSRMLFNRALIGNAFRKVFRCPIARKPVSRWVKAQNLIVSSDATTLTNASRVTEVIRVTQARMRRMQSNGTYLNAELVAPSGEVTDTERAEGEIEGIDPSPNLSADYEHLVYEVTTEVDSFFLTGLEMLDRDESGKNPGYPLPYRISIDRDSRAVLEIRRAWKKGDADHKRRRRYVKYGFVPGMSFYDFGMIHMAGNATLTATMIARSVTDSAMYANFPGGIYKQSVGTRMDNTVFRPLPGQFLPFNGGAGEKLSEILIPLPYKPPSAESMALGQYNEQKVKDLAGVIDLPVGEGRIGNTPVGTMMSYVEAVSQVPGAIHKDDHVAQSEEFDMLRELLAEQPELLTKGNRTPARKWQTEQELMAPDLIAAADPNTPSAVHRLMKLQGLLMAAAMPGFQGLPNWRELWDLVVRLLGNGNTGQYTAPPQAAQPPPPDPRIVAAQIKAQSQQQSDASKLQEAGLEHQGRMAELEQEGEQRDADRESDETRAAMTLQGTQLRAAHDTANAHADRAVDAGVAGAQLAQRHAQHLNEMGAAAAAPPAPEVAQ